MTDADISATGKQMTERKIVLITIQHYTMLTVCYITWVNGGSNIVKVTTKTPQEVSKKLKINAHYEPVAKLSHLYRLSM
jgi:hypothetical protein